MALVLSDGLLYMILMAFVSFSCCSYLILWTFGHDAPLTWSLEDVFMMMPTTLYTIQRTLHT
jgi:hypothetical protein